ncbi:nudix hydrolase 9 isoform X1 [Diospyros lotus]|uniref:nudix hydrolase 9 isoform X1 n=1 Tax=Diospyros lotus TaxID=55363 RepID=UPI00225BF42D|nr:nudix hydrolase 9 isoform X1 [Diospyros lotus]XP_052197672.1 nudix hydrolase 9 isoform X1 [Diospyros lotus]XP_052197681.1 nudix hydrolase 9 isoform X1 [Diospyros lotus]XP_052197688.1 nudix hydrolase 9 isoform X1 [Diospyros lotus]XP_052197693.1 nudix hydrolase 9 isoform X1 [Diospyros lotus]
MEKPNAEPVLDPPAYKLLLTCPSGLSPSQVSVVFDEAYDRIPHPAINLEDSISQIWDQRVQQNASFFNGKKFRYGGHMLRSVGDSNQQHYACLHLGLTDYRTFMGTNLNPSWEKFLVPSEDDCKQCQHTSSPLGNGAVVETSDKRIIVLQRSYNVGEFPGHYVFPGGHPEPQEVGIVSHQYDRDSKDAEIVNKKISQEMFDSIVREVVEEIGVPAASLCSPVFIGISRRVLNVRPAAFFFIKCSLESKEIQQLYSSAQDGYESTQIFTVSMNDLENMASKMPGCHQGGLALYKLMVEATKDT